MAWIRVDDTYFESPEVLEAGTEAALLNLKATAYSSRNLTDGVLSEVAIKALAGSQARMRRLVERLERSELWRARKEGGWVIRDYETQQQSREDVLRKREQAKDAAQKRWDAERMHAALPDAERNAEVPASQPGMRHNSTAPNKTEPASSYVHEDVRSKDPHVEQTKQIVGEGLRSRLDRAFEKLGCTEADEPLKQRLAEDVGLGAIVPIVERLAEHPAGRPGASPSSRISNYLAAAEDTIEAERLRVREAAFSGLPIEEQLRILEERQRFPEGL